MEEKNKDVFDRLIEIFAMLEDNGKHNIKGLNLADSKILLETIAPEKEQVFSSNFGENIGNVTIMCYPDESKILITCDGIEWAASDYILIYEIIRAILDYYDIDKSGYFEKFKEEI